MTDASQPSVDDRYRTQPAGAGQLPAPVAFPSITDISAGAISGNRGPVAVGSNIQQTIIEEERAYNVSGLPNPYLGLRSYTYYDRAIFAGRNRYIAQAISLLTDPATHPTLMFITGASGSGKSSVTQAGIIPALSDFYKNHDHLDTRYVVFRPGSQPMVALADELVQLGLAPSLTSDLQEQIADPAAFAHFILANTPQRQINLLVIDQFEEVFTQAQPTQRDAFLTLLTNLPPIAQLHSQFIATMRVDYLPNLFATKPLYDTAKQGIDLRAMSVDELKDAIQRPIQQLYPDNRFEPALVDRLASDASADATYLPLLQVTLEQLWKDGSLKLSAYHDLTSSIRQQAEDVYNFEDYAGLMQKPRPEADKATIMQLFLDLVQVGPDQDFADVRCPRELSELAKNDPDRQRLINDLLDARLLSSTTDAAGTVQIDIIHESLIKNWQRLQDAIKEQRQQLEQRQRFESTLDDWLESGRKDDYLLTGVRLAEARDLAATGDVAMQRAAAQEFVRCSEDAAQEAQARELKLAQDAAEAARSRVRILRRAIAVALLLAAVAVIASIFAFGNATEVTHQRDQAEGGRLALLASNELQDGNTEAALVLAFESEAREPNEEAESAMLAAAGKTINPIAVLNGHSDSVNMAAFSPDGKYIVTASNDKTARVWDSNGNTISVMSHTNAVKMATFSPDGNSILTVAGDSAFLWSRDGKLLKTFSHAQAVNTAVFSPDGKRVLTASDDATAVLWNIEDSNKVTLQNPGAVTSASYSPDGDSILTVASSNGMAKLWDKDGHDLNISFSNTPYQLSKMIFSPDSSLLVGFSSNIVDGWGVFLWKKDGTQLFMMNSDAPAWDAAISPDDRFIAIAHQDGTVSLIDSQNRIIDPSDKGANSNFVMKGHTAQVTHITYSPDGKYILTASDDNTARLWTSKGQPLYLLGGHTNTLTSAVFSRDGRRILTTSRDDTAQLWDVSGQPLTVLATQPCWGVSSWPPTVLSTQTCEVRSAVYSPDQKQIVVAAQFNADVWDIASSQVITTIPSRRDYGKMYDAIFSHNGRYVLAASTDFTAHLVDLKNNLQKALQPPHGGVVPGVLFSPDDSLIATTSCCATVDTWDIEGHYLATFPLPGAGTAAFSPDSKYLAVSTSSGAGLWYANTTRTDQPLKVFSQDDPIYSLAFSPDGQNLLSASAGNTVKLWDISTSEVITTLAHSASGASFSPDGKSILTASADGIAQLWDKQGTLLATMNGGNGIIWKSYFSPDGKYILTGAAKRTPVEYVTDAKTRLWDTNGTLLAELPGLALGFSPDSSRFLVGMNDGTLNDFSIHEYPVRHDDLMKIAACRVAQGLTPAEQQQFGIDELKFDITKRTCPPQVSWMQPQPTVTPTP